MAKEIPARQKFGTEWNIWQQDDGTFYTDQIQLVLLMEIREELKTLNRLLNCRRFVGIPHTLSRIDRRLAKVRPLKTRRRP